MAEGAPQGGGERAGALLLARGPGGPWVFASAYFVLASLSLRLGVPPRGFPVAWLPAGLLLAALATTEPRRWWLPALAGALAGQAAIAVAGGIPGGGAVFGLLVYASTLFGLAPTALVLRRAAPEPDPDRMLVAGTLVLGVTMVAGPLSSVAALAVLAATGQASDLPTASQFANWWAAVSTGALVAAPAALATLRPRRQRTPVPPFEYATAFLTLAVATFAIFLSSPSYHLPGVLVVPPLLWVASRLGGRVTSAAVLVLTLLAAAASISGLGRFAFPTPFDQALNLRLFLGTVAAIALLVTAAVEERRVAHHRLELIESVVARAADRMVVESLDGRLVWVNEALARSLGRPAAEVLGRPVWEVVPGLTAEGWAERLRRVEAAGAVIEEEAHLTPDGGALPLERSADLVEVGGERYLISVLRDVADRRRAEAALRAAGIGTLAAGLAHEINNPLSFVTGNVEFARRELQALHGRGRPAAPGDLEAPLEALSDAAEGARRVRDIVRDLQLFARERPGTEPVDVREAVRAALSMTQNEIRHRARLVTDLAEPLPPVRGNLQRLTQVFVNLLANAAQAIPEGQAGEHAVRVSVGTAGAEVEVAVGDTGGGISAAVLPRIFDPFFTTKGGRGGTGLGLSICQAVVSGHGGRIEVASAPGKGSTFRVRLPALPAGEQAAQGAREGAPPPPLARARLLVVDDEEKIGALVQRLVGGEHEVTVTASAAEALARIGDGRGFDAVLCDVMMPEMSGQDFAARLAAQAPALAARLAFMTGGAFTESARAFLAGRQAPALEKPFDAAGLRRLLASLLGAGPPAGAQGSR